jgi:hypothetical protein
MVEKRYGLMLRNLRLRSRIQLKVNFPPIRKCLVTAMAYSSLPQWKVSGAGVAIRGNNAVDTATEFTQFASRLDTRRCHTHRGKACQRQCDAKH